MRFWKKLFRSSDVKEKSKLSNNRSKKASFKEKGKNNKSPISNVTSQIFVSYSSKDSTKTQLLAQALENKGWFVWWDKKIPAGERFDQTISKALDNAKCIIVLWSKKSVNSDWVWNEATEGLERKILIPVLLDNVRIPLGFRRIQAVNLSRWRGAESFDEFQKLLKAVESLVGGSIEGSVGSENRSIGPTRQRRLSGALDGKTIVFTGKLAEPRRVHAQKVETVGARFTNSVSRDTDYLVVGDKPGDKKLADAKKYEIKSITEREWLQLLNDAYKRILKGKTVVFTGKLKNNRETQVQLAGKLGARVGNRITDNISYLIVGANPGIKKIEEAKKHHIHIISEGLWTEIVQNF